MQSIPNPEGVEARGRRAWRREDGQSIVELVLMLPIYILLMILVVQLSAMFFVVFDDLSDVRNTALEKGQKAESTHLACYEERSSHTILLRLSGATQEAETNVRLWAYGNGPPSCPN